MRLDTHRRRLRAIDGGEPEAAAAAAEQDSAATKADATAAAVLRAQAGDMDAWARLYQDHFDRIFRHVRYLCGDNNEAEELTQEAFVHAFTNIHKFEGRSSFSTWMHSVSLNVVRNHWRSARTGARARARLEHMTHVIEQSAPTPATQLLQRQREQALYVALEALPENLRLAFILRDLEGLSPQEAGDQLGITPGNLAVRATRARKRLRQELESMGMIEPEVTR